MIPLQTPQLADTVLGLIIFIHTIISLLCVTQPDFPTNNTHKITFYRAVNTISHYEVQSVNAV
jgi:hypothetical protein